MIRLCQGVLAAVAILMMASPATAGSITSCAFGLLPAGISCELPAPVGLDIRRDGGSGGSAAGSASGSSGSTSGGGQSESGGGGSETEGRDGKQNSSERNGRGGNNGKGGKSRDGSKDRGKAKGHR